MSRCTLEVGAHEVVVATGGTLDAEYALFDAGEIRLHSTDPGTNREAAYRTTAVKARRRLADQGITAQLASEATDATRSGAARAFARGEAVRTIADRLGASELFEGGTYDPSTRLYAGTWLDLAALSAEIGQPGAAALLQALHLASLLADQPDDQTVELKTATLTATRRPGERTFRRIVFDQPQNIVQAIQTVGSHPKRAETAAGPTRPEVIERLRERATRLPAVAALLTSLEAAVAARQRPSQGPLADPELWAIEAKLSQGDIRGSVDDLDTLEKRRGRLPGTAYLRARAELMTGSQDPRDLASKIAALSTSIPSFHELGLLAARAWTVAGEARHAKAFARDVRENATASDSLRVQALHLLEELETKGASCPNTVAASPRSLPKIPLAPANPSNVGMEQPISEPRVVSQAPAATLEIDRLEALSLPQGMIGVSVPQLDEPPRTPVAARLAFTFLTRELGRELRLRHGADARADIDGLELAQRYLRERLTDGVVRTRDDERELLRNGAFLSELLARRLGAYWSDLESTESTRWSMLVPAASASLPEPVRAWPFARVLRFIGMGHKERDLVSYYLELENRARRS